jgi:hypothetical protein
MTYIFLGHLNALSLVRIIVQRWVVGWLVNNMYIDKDEKGSGGGLI